MEQINNEIGIVNAAFLSKNGNLQCYAVRLRGEVDGKSIKISPASVHGRALIAGDVLYIHSAELENPSNSNYKTMRSGHITFAADDAPTTEASASTVEDNTLPEDSVF